MKVRPNPNPRKNTMFTVQEMEQLERQCKAMTADAELPLDVRRAALQLSIGALSMNVALLMHAKDLEELDYRQRLDETD